MQGEVKAVSGEGGRGGVVYHDARVLAREPQGEAQHVPGPPEEGGGEKE